MEHQVVEVHRVLRRERLVVPHENLCGYSLDGALRFSSEFFRRFHVVLGVGNDGAHQAWGKRLGSIPRTLQESFDEGQLVGIVVDREAIGETEQFRFAAQNPC